MYGHLYVHYYICKIHFFSDLILKLMTQIRYASRLNTYGRLFQEYLISKKTKKKNKQSMLIKYSGICSIYFETIFEDEVRIQFNFGLLIANRKMYTPFSLTININ